MRCSVRRGYWRSQRQIMGASIATLFFNRYPERVEKGILTCSGIFDKYYILVNKCSPTRKALAIIVNEGFTAALEGKKLPSTT